MRSTQKLSETEKFKFKGIEQNFGLIDFWKWAFSDLITNKNRGVLAEFIVARLLGLDYMIRPEWRLFDLEYIAGKSKSIKIEIKSAAYLQGWDNKKLSKIIFEISPKSVWLQDKQRYNKNELKRHSDVYIFCLLSHQDRVTLNPLELSQWDFFILRTEVLDEKKGMQKKISFESLLKLKPVKTSFDKFENDFNSCINET